MKKIILLCSILIFLSGCGEKNVKLKNNYDEQVEFICQINENDILHCDNEFSTYNEYGNLISISPKDSTNESYNYLYNEDGFITSIEKKDGEQIFITYNNNKNIDSIQYIMDPNSDDTQRTTINYIFLYDSDNKIKQIFKSYNHSNMNDIITYEYYNKNNIDYVKETKAVGEKKLYELLN